jgi:hypothetical protein
MSLLKKFFASKADQKKAKVQRMPRVKITPLHRIYFWLGIEKTNRLDVGNLSTSGMAVIRDEKTVWDAGEEIEGILVIDKEEMALKARVRHLSEALAGCEFFSDNPALSRAIAGYLKIEILALTLRKVNEQYLKPDPRGRVEWLTDGRQNELYCVLDDQGVVAFHMSFLGNYVEGGRGMEARGGTVNQDSRSAQGHKRSALIDLSSSLSPEMSAFGRTFVQNTEQLSEVARKEIERLIA